jgi:SAM-dependent methyltransferase
MLGIPTFKTTPLLLFVLDNDYHPPLARNLLKLCNLRPGQSVLDLACGTGVVALQAAAAVGPTGRVVGVDLSPAMLQQAADKAAAQDPSCCSTTALVCGDVECLQEYLEEGLKVRSAAVVVISACWHCSVVPAWGVGQLLCWSCMGAGAALHIWGLGLPCTQPVG